MKSLRQAPGAFFWGISIPNCFDFTKTGKYVIIFLKFPQKIHSRPEFWAIGRGQAVGEPALRI
ncbi:MAG TPA: hypothetical protein DD618_03190 [Acholeplasmatales bacterium]|nr:hypothetical protein [Acholeplasmatales bacterium]